MFLISAAGRDAYEILAALTERLGNDPDTELRVAAEEHRRITRLRLEKLMARMSRAGAYETLMDRRVRQ